MIIDHLKTAWNHTPEHHNLDTQCHQNITITLLMMLLQLHKLHMKWYSNLDDNLKGGTSSFIQQTQHFDQLSRLVVSTRGVTC